MMLLLGPFRAEGVNLAANDLVAGLPSPMAALGFVGALAHRAGKHDWRHAVLPIFHEVKISEGRTKATPGRGRNGYGNIELVENISGYVEFSLLAEFPVGVTRDVAQRNLPGMRFSGGAVFPRERGGQFPNCVREFSFIADGVDKAGRGYALTPPLGREAADCVSFGEAASLAALHERLFGRPRVKGGGYLVPAAVGLRLLEDAKGVSGRKGVRDPAISHVLTEPGAGIAELISTRNKSVWDQDDDKLRPRLWCWSCDHDRRLAMFSEFHLRAAYGETGEPNPIKE